MNLATSYHITEEDKRVALLLIRRVLLGALYIAGCCAVAYGCYWITEGRDLEQQRMQHNINTSVLLYFNYRVWGRTALRRAGFALRLKK